MTTGPSHGKASSDHDIRPLASIQADGNSHSIDAYGCMMTLLIPISN